MTNLLTRIIGSSALLLGAASPVSANVLYDLPFDNNGAAGRPISIVWAAPSSAENGQPISVSSLGGYRIYVGKQRNRLYPVVDIDEHYISQTEISGLAAGPYFVAVTAYDEKGNESDKSNIRAIRLARDPDGGTVSDTSESVNNNVSLDTIRRQIAVTTQQVTTATRLVQTRQTALNTAKQQLRKAKNKSQRNAGQRQVNSAQTALQAAQRQLSTQRTLLNALRQVEQAQVQLDRAQVALNKSNNKNRAAARRNVTRLQTVLRNAINSLNTARRAAA